jgi:hypothetical protein
MLLDENGRKTIQDEKEPLSFTRIPPNKFFCYGT